MKNIGLIIIGLSSVFATQAFSFGGGLSYKEALFWSGDKNRSGYLDIKEASSIHNLGNEKVFAKYDKNDDGAITTFEFNDYINQRSRTE
ncbi:MAG: EF-hand domain-containing protein [Gammaproteobacteria bacterium]|nr:EF-hand domain-containing protein [Gammaproteobacteria bacterium]